MACCTDLQLPHDDDYSVAESDDEKTNQARRKLIDSENKKKRLNVPYTKATPLFKAIEKQQWESVLMFLNTSKWSNSFFVSSTDHFKNPTPIIQCQTWVTYYNPANRQIEWCQLPIHAAISYAAPAVVIQKMVDIYPDCLKLHDHEGMLPVHLAFGFALPDPVLSLLLKTYPQSAQERGPGGRLPHQCCELGPNKIRGEVFGFIAEQTSDMARNDQEEYFKGYIVENHKKLAIDETVTLDGKDLKELLSDLIEDRKQLLDLKKKIKKATAAAKAKTSDENPKTKSTKSPRGKVKSTKDSSHLSIDTDIKNEDIQIMSIKGGENSPTARPQSSKNSKTARGTEDKISRITPKIIPKSTTGKYSSKLSKTREAE
jgi:hypothetical protein